MTCMLAVSFSMKLRENVFCFLAQNAYREVDFVREGKWQ